MAMKHSEFPQSLHDFVNAGMAFDGQEEATRSFSCGLWVELVLRMVGGPADGIVPVFESMLGAWSLHYLQLSSRSGDAVSLAEATMTITPAVG